MKKKFNYTIEELIDFANSLSEYQIINRLSHHNYKENSTYYQFKDCPVCSHKNHFTVYKNTNTYRSFNDCCKSGNILTFLEEVEKQSKSDVLAEWELLIKGDKNKKKPALINPLVNENIIILPKVSEQKILEINYLSYYEKLQTKQSKLNNEGIDYIKKRKISIDIINKFKINYDEAWIYPNKDNSFVSKRIIIPTSKSSYVARAIEEKENSRYLKVGNTNFLNIKSLTSENPPVTFITEGEFDTLSILSLGYNSISLSGINNINTLKKYLQEKTNIKELKFIILLDNDEAGKRATEELFDSFLELEIPIKKSYISDLKFVDDALIKDVNEALIKDENQLKEFLLKELKEFESVKVQKIKKIIPIKFDENGKVNKSMLNYCNFLLNEYNFRFNDISKELEENGKELTDVDMGDHYIKFQNLYNHSIISKEERNIAYLVLEKKVEVYNPFFELINKAPWDKEERFNNFFPKYLGVKEEELTTATTELFFKAILARNHYPGTQFDYMLILAGKQGIGKSVLLMSLAIGLPYYEPLTNIRNEKAIGLKMNKVLIGDFDELAEFSKTKVADMKRFITIRNNTFRQIYEKKERSYPRKTVLFGSTNSETFLKDETGERRFYVLKSNLPFEGMIPELKTKKGRVDLNEYVLQMYREVEFKYKDDHEGLRELYLSDRLSKLNQLNNEQYRVNNENMDAVIDFLAKKSGNLGFNYILEEIEFISCRFLIEIVPYFKENNKSKEKAFLKSLKNSLDNSIFFIRQPQKSKRIVYKLKGDIAVNVVGSTYWAIDKKKILKYIEGEVELPKKIDKTNTNKQEIQIKNDSFDNSNEIKNNFKNLEDYKNYLNESYNEVMKMAEPTEHMGLREELAKDLEEGYRVFE